MYNIAVIGCGAIGITSALAIQKRLNAANVTIFTKDISPNTTSDVAAGLWEPYLLEDTPSEKIFQWSKMTYDYLLDLWKSGKAKEAGICLQPVIYLSDNEEFKLPLWLSIPIGFSELPKERIKRYSEVYNQKLTGGFVFATFTWEATKFIPFLTDEFIQNGGKIVRKVINDVDEISHYDVVVNCTGISSKELLGDWNVKPIRGQIVRVKAPWQFHTILNDSKRTCYIIPNIDCVILGGTKQELYNTQVDEVDKRDILRNCSMLMPSIKSAEIIKHQVGLRPARDKVRLEAEIRGNGKNCENGVRIVHNYGHGGAGITLSVGCAQEAAELVESLLNKRNRSKL